MLIVFAIIALVKVYGGSAPAGSIHPAWSWLDRHPAELARALTSATLIAVFIYWGWDTAVSINEETAEPGEDPRPRRDHLDAAAAADLRAS